MTLSQYGPHQWLGWQHSPIVDIPEIPVRSMRRYKVPRTHWRKGALVWPEEGTEVRAYHRMLEDYHDMAAVQQIADTNAIPINYYRRVCQYWSTLMTAVTPLAGGDEVDESIMDAIHDLTTDYVRYGTAAGYYAGGTWTCLQPEMLVPGTRGDITYISYIRDDDIMLIHRTMDGMVSMSHARIEHEYIEPTITSMSRWHGLSNAEYIHVTRRPQYGRYWGTSMYLDMVPLVSQIQHRMGMVSEALDSHSRPVLLVVQDPLTEPDLDTPGTEPSRYLDLIKAHGRTVMVLSHEYKDAKYLSWDPQLQGVQAQIERLEDALYSATALPAGLQASDRGIVATGVGLRRLYAPTYLAMASLLRKLKPAVAAMAGVSEDQLEWEHPFDMLDIQVVAQGGEEMLSASEPGSGTNVTGTTKDGERIE